MRDKKKVCRELVEKLGEDEQETAALTSYAYSIAASSEQTCPSPEIRLKMAMRFARRHLVAENGDAELALSKMKSTLEWRKENRIDELRRCFHPQPDDDQERMAYLRRLVETEHARQKGYVSGFDRDGRAVMTRWHRTDSATDQPGYFLGSVYLLERTLACTEFASLGTEEKMLTVCDYSKYSIKTVPKKADGKMVIQSMQDHYPERLQHYYIIWCEGGGVVIRAVMKTVWSVVQLFLDPETKNKIQFLLNKKLRDEVVSQRLADDQAMPFMLTSGTQTSDIDMNTFLRDCPFTCSANEIY